ncbi:MAG: DUF3822 family protein [Bacteroidales bacterium]|nr:DUF3822 family protein [Bacteroidales bacterium]MCF6342936.1 DUF3822 family protein [Bacteroidales bacterium]
MPHQLYPNSSLLDKSFHERNTRNYVMSAQLSIHGFTLCVYNPATNKIAGLFTHSFDTLEKAEEITGRLAVLLDEVSWLAFPFSKVCMFYGSNLNTLIPRALFDEKNAALYLEFNQGPLTKNRIVFDSLKHTDAVNVYCLPETLVEKIKTLWPNVLLKHASTGLIEHLAVLVKNKADSNTLFAHVGKNSFDLVFFRENKLVFYNRFRFMAKEDFIYFLLSAIEQLDLNPETVKLVLLGNIAKGDVVYEIIYRYIRHISFVGRNDNFSYSYVLDEVKAHEHFVLFNGLQCE